MKIIDDKILHSQKWTRVKEARYLDREGGEHSWTYIERTNDQRAVVVIPTTELTGSLILIRQFRIPFRRELVEFPAGLVDEGERPEETAIRELAEETGYSGVIEEMGPEVSTSAGITTETVTVVRMRVGEEPVSQQRLEGAEHIEVIKVGPHEVRSFLTSMIEQKVLFDAKVYVYLSERARAE